MSKYSRGFVLFSLLASFCFLCWFPYPVRKYSSGLVQLSRLASLCVAQLESLPCEKVFQLISCFLNWLCFVLSAGFMTLWASNPVNSFCCFTLLNFAFSPVSLPCEHGFQWIRFVFSSGIFLISQLDPLPCGQVLQWIRFVVFVHNGFRAVQGFEEPYNLMAVSHRLLSTKITPIKLHQTSSTLSQNPRKNTKAKQKYTFWWQWILA